MGVGVLVGLFYLAMVAADTVSWLIRNMFAYVVFAAIVPSRPRFGARWRTWAGRGSFAICRDRNPTTNREELVVAATMLASQRTGAIIAVSAISACATIEGASH